MAGTKYHSIADCQGVLLVEIAICALAHHIKQLLPLADAITLISGQPGGALLSYAGYSWLP